MRARHRRSSLRLLQGIVVKEAKIMTRYVGTLLMILLMPFMISGLFVGIGYGVAGPAAAANFASNTGVESPILYMTLGSLLMMSSMIMVENTSSVIREEQLIGTFELHYLTPNNTVLLWLYHAVATSIMMLAVFTVDITAVIVLHGALLSLTDWITAALIVLLGLLPLAGLGLVVAALTVRFKEVWAVASTLNSFIAMLSGFYYPLEIFPRVVQLISYALPTSHAASVLRGIFTGASSGLAAWQRIVLMLALALVYLLVGKTFYGRWEDEARRRGELSKY